MGDNNIDLLNIKSHGPASDYNDTMHSCGFIPSITSATRITNSSTTLIDDIFANQFSSQLGESLQGICSLIFQTITLYFIWQKVANKKVNTVVSKRSYSNKNET